MSSSDERWDALFATVRRDPSSDAAWAAVYSALWPVLAEWVAGRYRLDAEAAGDVLQEAFLQYRAKLVAGRVPFASVVHLRTFVRFSALMHLRARARFVPIEDLPEIEDAGASAMATRLFVDEAIDRLDPPCAYLLRETYLVGRPAAELARVLDVSEGALRVRLHRCRERLRALLQSVRD